MSHIKDFESWNKEKQKINKKDSKKKSFHNVGEIWWCKVGVNVGFEIDGKENFLRPVLIYKTLTPDTFFGIPLTKKKEGEMKDKIEKFYYKLETFELDGVSFDSLLSLQDIRKFDNKRLENKYKELPSNKYKEIRKKLKEIF